MVTVEGMLREINPDLYEKKEEKKEIIKRKIHIKSPKIKKMIYRKMKSSPRPTIHIKSRVKPETYRSLYFNVDKVHNQPLRSLFFI